MSAFIIFYHRHLNTIMVCLSTSSGLNKFQGPRFNPKYKLLSEWRFPCTLDVRMGFVCVPCFLAPSQIHVSCFSEDNFRVKQYHPSKSAAILYIGTGLCPKLNNGRAGI